MPLTPEDVSNKRFTPVRLREGYDMGEVDQFLDEVEAELERLLKENDDLRSKRAAAQKGAPLAAPVAVEPEPVKAPEPEPVAAPAPAPAATDATPPADDAAAAPDAMAAPDAGKSQAAPMKPMGSHADAMKSAPTQGVRHDKKDKDKSKDADTAKTYGPGWDEQKCAQAHKDGSLIKKGDCPD